MGVLNNSCYFCIYVYRCTIRVLYQMMFMSFNSNTICEISGAGTTFLFRSTCVYIWCWFILRFMYSVLQISVCLFFVLFLFVIALFVLLRFKASDYPHDITEILLKVALSTIALTLITPLVSVHFSYSDIQIIQNLETIRYKLLLFQQFSATEIIDDRLSIILF